MKKKVSISIDESVLEQIKVHLEEGIFRNQSHFIEFATKKLLGEK